MADTIVKTLNDIIEVAEVKLVIELDDADRHPAELRSSFVMTAEAEAGLNSILKSIDEYKGCGVFLRGHFGSGKSHFLAFLYLLLRDKHLHLKEYPGLLAKEKITVKKISLVKYPASRPLEDIVQGAFPAQNHPTDRDALFDEIVKTPTVIIIDELSEFLRSKSTPSAFYEDVRFLQFMGEFSLRRPLWVIASLQEWIEETGHISSSLFNRIKDRYPLRINLSSTHIEDIIDQRIIVKKEGSE